jgi:hypothetical protein
MASKSKKPTNWGPTPTSIMVAQVPPVRLFSVYTCVRPIRLCNAVNENNPSVVIVQVALRKWVERMW